MPYLTLTLVFKNIFVNLINLLVSNNNGLSSAKSNIIVLIQAGGDVTYIS